MLEFIALAVIDGRKAPRSAATVRGCRSLAAVRDVLSGSVERVITASAIKEIF